MSRLDIQDTLFRGWALVTDNMNYGLVEASEFDLWAYSSPLGDVEWEALS
jgi:hypothetical protein